MVQWINEWYANASVIERVAWYFIVVIISAAILEWVVDTIKDIFKK